MTDSSATKQSDLLPNELLVFSRSLGAESLNTSDKAIEKKYRSGEVRIVTEQARYPLPSIKSMVDSDEYELNPEFQRRFRWDTAKQSKLIESFIMNVPIPPIFLYESEYSHYEVMDGLQRLTAIYEFYTDKFALADLDQWPELNGRTYSSLPDQIRRGVDRRYLSSVILLQETARDPVEAQRLKQLVFERINSGGEKLEGQESRNAIYSGPLNQLCIALSRNEHLCMTWEIPKPDMVEVAGGAASAVRLKNELYRKMQDVELVLRFFAYRQRYKHEWGGLGEYLDRYLNLGNQFSSELLEELKDLFEQTIKLAYLAFGDKSFKMRREYPAGIRWTRQPSMVVYDALMYVLSKNLNRSSEIIDGRSKIHQALEGFYDQNMDLFRGRDVNKAHFEARVQKFSEFLDQQLSA